MAFLPYGVDIDAMPREVGRVRNIMVVFAKKSSCMNLNAQNNSTAANYSSGTYETTNSMKTCRLISGTLLIFILCKYLVCQNSFGSNLQPGSGSWATTALPDQFRVRGLLSRN